MGLAALITEARAVASLDEKGKPGGAPDKGNPKRKALIKKLKKNKSVRDPEALASWIGMKMASMHGGLKAAKRKKSKKSLPNLAHKGTPIPPPRSRSSF